MSTQYLKAFRADIKSCPVRYELEGLKTGIIRSHTSNIESLVRLIPIPTSKYILLSQWVPVLAPTHLLPLWSECLFALRERLFDMLRSTFEIGEAQLRVVTKIAQKSYV